MPISVRPKPYIIPEYSLTGDLLSYLTCGLQYRYHNKGSLPPSKPVQLWFGEFIHGVMEEAYLEWRDNNRQQFPWNWDSIIRDIEMEINRRLRSRGLYSPPRLFCPFDSTMTSRGLCPDVNHPHKMIASKRAETAINTWGQHLFPLISEVEVKLSGLRDMPNYIENISRSNYYCINGIVDVISFFNLQNAPSGNLILHYIQNNENVRHIINNLNINNYEIIIDYKGMRRPSNTSESWSHHEWQIKTYTWLRAKQSRSRRVIAGILFYLNELEPSQEDLISLKDELENYSTDILPEGRDRYLIQNWRRNTTPPDLTRTFREQRSIKIVPVDEESIQLSLANFDNVVNNIEKSVVSEIDGNSIINSWCTNPEERTCTACDFKTFCPNPLPRPYQPTVR